MKERELRQRARCSICGKPVGPAPVFYTLTMETWRLNFDAIRRQDGLAAFVGSSMVANIMGPDEDMATSLGTVELTVCLSCASGEVCLAEHTAPRATDRE